MIATETATRFNREPSKILGQVERGETIIIERQGQPTIFMARYGGHGISGEELSRRLLKLKAAPKAARELEKIVEALDDASRSSYPH